MLQTLAGASATWHRTPRRGASCGTAHEPHKMADFVASSASWGSDAAVNLCRQRYSLLIITRIGGTLKVAGADVAESSSSYESSSSSS